MAVPEKYIRTITISLGVVVSILIGIIAFRLLSESLVKAENIAPQNLSIVDIQQNSVKIEWITDRETQSVVEYGTSPTSLTFFAPESIKAQEHSVELNLLSEGTTYYFQIKTGEESFNNGGVPWTFTTLSANTAQPSILPTPTQQPLTSPTATAAITPTTASQTENQAKDTECSLNEYKAFFNTSNTKYDQNDDGVVKFNDVSICYAKYKTTPTP